MAYSIPPSAPVPPVSASVSPEEVAILAATAGIWVPEEDLEHLARSLAEHLDAVAPLLAADLTRAVPALRLDPRWRG
jgi:hypothetical protein